MSFVRVNTGRLIAWFRSKLIINQSLIVVPTTAPRSILISQMLPILFLKFLKNENKLKAVSHSFATFWGGSRTNPLVGQSLKRVFRWIRWQLSWEGTGSDLGTYVAYERKWAKEPWDFHTLKVEEVGQAILVQDIICDPHSPSRADERWLSAPLFWVNIRGKCSPGNIQQILPASISSKSKSKF